MPEDNSLFLKRKRAASGGTRTCDVLHTRQMLYQLSHRGSSAGQAESLILCKGKVVSSLINRVTLSQYCACVCKLYMYMYMYSLHTQ